MKVSDPSLNGKLEIDLKDINTPSSLVRLGKKKGIKHEKTYQLDLVKQASRINRTPPLSYD